MFTRNDLGDSRNTSFLPDDYLARRAERRTNLLCLTLFSVVIFGVVGAFFVTNRQWMTVKDQQESINLRYTQAAQQIEQLKVLENQKDQMLSKAELTTALIEKVPRSLLLADLINRMPQNLSLLEFDLTSRRVDPAQTSSRKTASSGPRSLAGRSSRGGSSNAGDDEEEARPQPPRYRTSLVLIGVATSHEEVSAYLAKLQESPLLRNVEMKFSEVTMIDNRDLSKFRIEADLKTDADARRIEPLTAARLQAFGENDERSQANAQEEK